MPCDHATTRASLTAFLHGTTFMGFVVLADEVEAQGRCNGCDSTLSVSVALARGTAVHGAIGAGKTAETLEMRMAEMEREAGELLRRTDR